MFYKIVGRVCGTEECAEKGRTKEPVVLVCEACGSEMKPEKIVDARRVAALAVVSAVVLGGGSFLAYQSVKAKVIGAVSGLGGIRRGDAVPKSAPGTGGVADQAVLRELERLNQDGDFASVQKRGEEYLANNPRDATVLNNVATAALRQGSVDAARGYLKRAIDLKPNDGYFRYNLGCVEARSGNKDEAVGHLKKACQLGLAPANFRQDPDLASLTGYASFEDLVVHKKCQ